MCGIAGIVDRTGAVRRFKEALGLMQRSLRHRGPDNEGDCIFNDAALAHTRLSIIGGESGRQPLFNEDRSIVLVANGEIYNYRQLRDRLSRQGHRFATRSDCETIIHLYEQYGKHCVEHLEGMFAFALWDAGKRQLLLARDRFGIKPLYMARLDDAVAFASEATAIIRSGLLERRINTPALHAYLALSYVPGSACIFKGVEKIQPAERVIIHRDRDERDCYWHPQTAALPLRGADAVIELRRRLDQSVSAHLASDVPVAAFLSGGVDSSAVAAMACRHSRLDTLCVAFCGSAFDESPYAERVARHLGTRHHKVSIAMEPIRLLEEAVGFMDEPFADSSALPAFAVCRAARGLAKVVLSGDGGDEVFGGYTGRYRVAALKAAVPRPRQVAELLMRLPPWRSGRRTSTPQMLKRASLSEKDRFLVERQITLPRQRAALMGEIECAEWESLLGCSAEKALAEAGFDHPVQRALWVDLRTSLPDDMLTKMDRMSMAHGLEVRVPFLDHSLVEFALSLPPEQLVSPFPMEGKRILRRVVRPLLPPGAVDRPKQGFTVPLNQWLMEGLLERFDTTCLSPHSRLGEWMDTDAIAAMRRAPVAEMPREDLYALLVLELWLRSGNG